jgi:hypothetical protein
MKPKLIKALTNILPLTIDELKGRKFDSTGRAKYCVHLIIDSVRTNQVQNINRVASSSIQFNYSFHGALLVLDSLERPVSMLKLVDINEVFEFRKEVNTGAEPGIYEYENVYDTSGMVVGRRLIEVVKPYYPVYNNSNDPKEYLAYTHLLDICEDKVYNVQRLLRRMK